jgi:hypothetical protein
MGTGCAAHLPILLLVPQVLEYPALLEAVFLFRTQHCLQIMFCRNLSSSLIHPSSSLVVGPSLVHLKRHAVSTHPCTARRALLALRIYQFHVLSSLQASCQVALVMIRYRVASLVLYLRAGSILRIPLSTLCNRDHVKNVKTKNKMRNSRSHDYALPWRKHRINHIIKFRKSFSSHFAAICTWFNSNKQRSVIFHQRVWW